MRYLFFLLFIFASCTPQGSGNMKNSTVTKTPDAMQQTINQKYLLNLWRHSHEEDKADEKVYRPGTFKFPPSRGRFAFELQAGGTAVIYAIARGDGEDKQKGTWTLVGKTLTLNFGSGDRPAKVFSVVSTAEDKLVLKLIA